MLQRSVTDKKDTPALKPESEGHTSNTVYTGLVWTNRTRTAVMEKILPTSTTHLETSFPQHF